MKMFAKKPVVAAIALVVSAGTVPLSHAALSIDNDGELDRIEGQGRGDSHPPVDPPVVYGDAGAVIDDGLLDRIEGAGRGDPHPPVDPPVVYP